MLACLFYQSKDIAKREIREEGSGIVDNCGVELVLLQALWWGLGCCLVYRVIVEDVLRSVVSFQAHLFQTWFEHYYATLLFKRMLVFLEDKGKSP